LIFQTVFNQAYLVLLRLCYSVASVIVSSICIVAKRSERSNSWPQYA